MRCIGQQMLRMPPNTLRRNCPRPAARMIIAGQRHACRPPISYTYALLLRTGQSSGITPIPGRRLDRPTAQLRQPMMLPSSLPIAPLLKVISILPKESAGSMPVLHPAGMAVWHSVGEERTVAVWMILKLEILLQSQLQCRLLFLRV